MNTNFARDEPVLETLQVRNK